MVDKNIFSFWFCVCINCKQRIKVWSPKVMTGRGIDQLNIYIYIVLVLDSIQPASETKYLHFYNLYVLYLHYHTNTSTCNFVTYHIHITCIWADSRVRVVVKWELARTALFETVFQHLQTLNHIFNETSGRFPGMFVVTEKHYMISS